MVRPSARPDIEFETLRTAGLTAEHRALMSELFDICYRQANHAHLKRPRVRYGK